MQQIFATIAPADQRRATTAAITGGNNGGGRGGRGGFPNMANLDEATRDQVLCTTMQTARTKQTTETMAAILKVLTKAQKTTYKPR